MPRESVISTSSGKPGERRFPVGGARDHAQMRGLAGTIDAAIGEQVGGQLLRRLRVLDAAGVEAREVELASAAS